MTPPSSQRLSRSRRLPESVPYLRHAGPSWALDVPAVGQGAALARRHGSVAV